MGDCSWENHLNNRGSNDSNGTICCFHGGLQLEKSLNWIGGFPASHVCLPKLAPVTPSAVSDRRLREAVHRTRERSDDNFGAKWMGKTARMFSGYRSSFIDHYDHYLDLSDSLSWWKSFQVFPLIFSHHWGQIHNFERNAVIWSSHSEQDSCSDLAQADPDSKLPVNRSKAVCPWDRCDRCRAPQIPSDYRRMNMMISHWKSQKYGKHWV